MLCYYNIVNNTNHTIVRLFFEETALISVSTGVCEKNLLGRTNRCQAIITTKNIIAINTIDYIIAIITTNNIIVTITITKLSDGQIRGWVAVSAAGLLGKGLRKRNAMFTDTGITPSLSLSPSLSLPVSVNKNTPPENSTHWNVSSQSTISGAGEQFLMLHSRERAAQKECLNTGIIIAIINSY